MKIFIPLAILLSIFIASHTYNSAITPEDIQVLKIKKHPLLVDYTKLLRITQEGNILDEEPMFQDPGAGCPSSLFEEEEAYILIECNGFWYSIDKQKGKITVLGWKWEAPLPKHYLGTFMRSYEAPYTLIQQATIQPTDVYLIKDPDQN